MDYKASMDGRVKIITFGIMILFGVGLSISLFRILSSSWHPKHPLSIFGSAASVIVISGVCYGFCKVKYRVSQKTLMIIAPLYTKVIDKQDIAKAQIVDRLALGGLIRTMGIGGLFGYYGWYRGTKVGSFFFYGTQMKNLILIETKAGKKYVITPDDTSILSAIEPFSAHFS